MDFDWNIFVYSLGPLLKGCVVTAELSVISIAIGIIIGTLGGVARFSNIKIVSALMRFYVTIFRGVPLLVTLLFLYYGLPAAGILLDAFTVAVIALSVTNGAYITEIVLGSIESLDTGQMRAARSVTRIWPRCGHTGALSPKIGANLALPSPAARTILGAAISSAPVPRWKSPGAACASVIVRLGR